MLNRLYILETFSKQLEHNMHVKYYFFYSIIILGVSTN